MVFCLLLLQFVLTVQAIKHNFEHRTEIENKVGISFALEQTEVVIISLLMTMLMSIMTIMMTQAKLTMHNELAARFQDSSLETLSQVMIGMMEIIDTLKLYIL